MARKKPSSDTTFVMFNVVYQDGSLSSNRRIPRDIVGGLDGDEPARTLIEQQDREIAEKSGRPRGPIKTMVRSPGQ